MFGNMNKPAFGAAAPSTSFGFGQNANTTNPFGQTQSLFSKPSTAFGTTTSTFGQPATTSLFGASSQPQQTGLFGQTNTSTFGAAPTTQTGFGSSLFGQQPSSTGLFNSTSTFGQQPKPTFGGFGAAQPTQQSTGLFGTPQQPQQTSTLFGQSATTTGLFGSTPAFGGTQQNGTTIKFNPVTGTDTMMKNGTSQSINTKHHSITCMKEYEAKSFEELRLEDYVANRKGPQQGTGFGGSTFGAQASAAPSLFGQPADANKPAFGQTAPTFGQTTTPFGQANTFNLGAQQNTTSSPFGAKPTTFGAPATSSFGFGAQQQQQPSTGLFGANTAQKPFGTTTSQSLFGTNTAQQPAFGGGMGLTSNANTNSLFGKPAQSAPLFGAQPAQNTFSFNTPASTQSSLFTSAAKPLFGGGTTTPAFGTTTNAFGANTGFNSTFGKTTSAFGTTATPAFGSTFGAATNQNTSIFGNQNQPKPGGLFGNTGTTGLFNTNTTGQGFQSNTGFGMGQPQQQNLFPGATQDQTQHNNLATMTSDPFGDAPHLAGLEPKLASNTNAMSATDPKELKALLDASKKVDMSHNSKLKVIPARSMRESLFDSIPKGNESSKSPLTEYHKTSCRRLILRREPATEHSPSSMSGNILDVLNSEDKENAIKEQSKKLSTLTENKVNPMRLHFDRSMDDKFYEVNASGNKDQLNETASDNPSSPPSDDEGEGAETSPTVKTHPCNVVCSRPEYYTLPNLDELTPDKNGCCFVKGFTVGRKSYGNVYFPDEIDVSGFNIDELVHFRYREINIYPDDTKKPPVGQGLNRRAQVTLDNVYPKRSGTNTLIKDVGELLQMNFAEKLRKVSERKGARFVDYRPETGSWVFKVDHFSRYGFNDSDEENEQNAEANKAQKSQKSKEVTLVEKLTLSSETFNKERDSFERESSKERPLHSTGFGLDKDIIIDDDFDQDDVLHQSMLVDDMESNMADYHHIPTDVLMDFHPFGSIKSSKNIQVMKSTLFADEDRLSDSAGSQASIVKQYLDLQDDIEALPRLPVVAEEVAMARKRPMLKPKIWNVLNSFETLGYESEVLPNRCCTDLSMFKGKSFKVGWSRGFNFCVFGDEDRESNSEIRMKAFDKSPSFDPLNDALLDSLKTVLEESTYNISPTGIPTFKIRKTEAYLKKQTALFEKLASQYNSKQANYLYNIWTLCRALWGVSENTVANRRHLLTQWLKETTATEDLPLKTGPFESTSEAVESIFEHLSTFKILDAANIAMQNRMAQLSLLIAQLSVPNLTKAFMQEQIENWYSSMAANHISDEMKKVYLLLAGIPTKDNINIFEDLDWKRAFAMHLWYICPNGAPIELAIELYKKAFEEYSYAERPNPIYLEGQFLEDGPFDVMYHILTLYRSGIHRLSSVLNPATLTSDPLDYRLSWLLLQLFQSLDVGLIETAELNQLCTSFSNQLEHLGHWDWAIFILLHLKDDSAKKTLVMGILERNLSPDYDPESQETVDTLVNEMKVPSKWIHEVKGFKSLNSERYLESFNHFSLAGDSITGNQVFIEHLLPNLFINEQFEVLKKLIEKIEPLEPNSPASLFNEFLNLQEQSIVSKIDSVLKLQMKLNLISERIQNFPVKTDQQKLCIAELSKRCATLYKEFCKKSNSGRFKESYMQFVETLAMPPDFKQNEGLYLINDFCSRQ